MTLTSHTYALCTSSAWNVPTWTTVPSTYGKWRESNLDTMTSWKPSWSYTVPYIHSTCVQCVYMSHKIVHLNRLVATKAPLYAYTVDWAFVHITHQWNFVCVCVLHACFCVWLSLFSCFDRSQLPCSRSAHGEMFHQLMAALVHEPFDTVLSTVQKAWTHTHTYSHSASFNNSHIMKQDDFFLNKNVFLFMENKL